MLRIISKFKRLFAYLTVASMLLFFLPMVTSYFDVIAADNMSLATIAANIMESFQKMGELMIAIAYISGFGFTVSSIFKFKQHKDNPTQIPVSTPLALLMVGVILIFLPGIIKPTGYTIFGTSSNLEEMAGGFKGQGADKLPGGK